MISWRTRFLFLIIVQLCLIHIAEANRSGSPKEGEACNKTKAKVADENDSSSYYYCYRKWLKLRCNFGSQFDASKGDCVSVGTGCLAGAGVDSGSTEVYYHQHPEWGPMNYDKFMTAVSNMCQLASCQQFYAAIKKGFRHCPPKGKCPSGYACNCGILHGERYWSTGCGAGKYSAEITDCAAKLELERTETGWEKLGFFCTGKRQKIYMSPCPATRYMTSPDGKYVFYREPNPKWGPMTYRQYWHAISKICRPANRRLFQTAVVKGFSHCPEVGNCVRGRDCDCGLLYGGRYWATGCGQYNGEIFDCSQQLGLKRWHTGWEKLGFFCYDQEEKDDCIKDHK